MPFAINTTTPKTSHTNVTPTQASIEKYQFLEKVAKIIKLAGIVLMITGAAGAALFFSAPISAPLLIAGAIFSLIAIPIFCSSTGGDIQGTFDTCKALMFGIGGGLVGGAVAGYSLYQPLAKFVYIAKVATIAGIAAGAITAGGGLIFGIGACAEIYCKNKVFHLLKPYASS